MSSLPVLKPIDVIKVLTKHCGFLVDHVSGSHYILWHPDGRRVTVPVHGGELKTSTLLSIIKQTHLTREEFIGLFR